MKPLAYQPSCCWMLADPDLRWIFPRAARFHPASSVARHESRRDPRDAGSTSCRRSPGLMGESNCARFERWQRRVDTRQNAELPARTRTTTGGRGPGRGARADSTSASDPAGSWTTRGAGATTTGRPIVTAPPAPRTRPSCGAPRNTALPRLDLSQATRCDDGSPRPIRRSTVRGRFHMAPSNSPERGRPPSPHHDDDGDGLHGMEEDTHVTVCPNRGAQRAARDAAARPVVLRDGTRERALATRRAGTIWPSVNAAPWSGL